MSGGAGQVLEAARCLRDALRATSDVRLRHRVPNSWCALAILLHAVPGRTVRAADFDLFGSNPSYVLHGLRAAGLIEEVGEPRDRRTRALRLTERGAAVAGELRRVLGGVVDA